MMAERDTEKDRETEISIHVREMDVYLTSIGCAPTRYRTYNLGMCPDQGLNPHPFGAKDNAPTN